MSDENTDQSDGIASLRKAHDELAKQNKELLEKLNGFEAEKRSKTVAETLKAKGLPEKVATLYNGDDFSPEAVGKWADDYADVFGAKPATSQPQGQTPGQQALFAQMQKVQAESFGTPPLAGAPEGMPVLGDPIEMEHFMRTAPREQLEQLGYLPKPGTMFNPQRG